MSDYQRFCKNYAQKHNCASLAACAYKLRTAQNTNQAAFIFAFKRPARSFAGMFTTPDSPELSEAAFMYGTEHLTQKNHLLHELLHVFGAADYYYPPAVNAAAERYFPRSVMKDASRKELGEIDSLTKYLIGWTSAVPREGALFMQETAKLTNDDLTAGHKEETTTVSYAVKKLDTGTYYGPLSVGVMHGRGRFVFTNGDVYEGDFSNGRITGKGRYRFTSGTVYEGDFVNGQINGKGTMTYKNGKKLTGLFLNGRYAGKK